MGYTLGELLGKVELPAAPTPPSQLSNPTADDYNNYYTWQAIKFVLDNRLNSQLPKIADGYNGVTVTDYFSNNNQTVPLPNGMRNPAQSVLNITAGQKSGSISEWTGTITDQAGNTVSATETIQQAVLLVYEAAKLSVKITLSPTEYLPPNYYMFASSKSQRDKWVQTACDKYVNDLMRSETASINAEWKAIQSLQKNYSSDPWLAAQLKGGLNFGGGTLYVIRPPSSVTLGSGDMVYDGNPKTLRAWVDAHTSYKGIYTEQFIRGFAQDSLSLPSPYTEAQLRKLLNAPATPGSSSTTPGSSSSKSLRSFGGFTKTPDPPTFSYVPNPDPQPTTQPDVHFSWQDKWTSDNLLNWTLFNDGVVPTSTYLPFILKAPQKDPTWGIEVANAQLAANFDPLLIDLGGNGFSLSNADNGRYIQLSQTSNFAVGTSWIAAGSGNGVLFYDPTNSGALNSPAQMFGNQFVESNGTVAPNGFAALASLDSNGDGVINASDSAFSDIKIQKDDGTVVSLADVGITSISLVSSASGTTDANGNVQVSTAMFTRADSSTGQIADYNLVSDPTFSQAVTMLPETSAVTALPDIAGYGTVYTLHQAMLRNSTGTLQNLVQEFVSTDDPVSQESLLRQIMVQWTGSEGVNPHILAHMDGQTENVVEQFMGQQFIPSSLCVNLT